VVFSNNHVSWALLHISVFGKSNAKFCELIVFEIGLIDKSSTHMLQLRIHLSIFIESPQSLQLPYWGRELERQGYQSQRRGKSAQYQTLLVRVEM
jgi:hypothetical protein